MSATKVQKFVLLGMCLAYLTYFHVGRAEIERKRQEIIFARGYAAPPGCTLVQVAAGDKLNSKCVRLEYEIDSPKDREPFGLPKIEKTDDGSRRGYHWLRFGNDALIVDCEMPYQSSTCPVIEVRRNVFGPSIT